MLVSLLLAALATTPSHPHGHRAPGPVIPGTLTLPESIKGFVRDGKSGKPLVDALVEQTGSVDSALTGADGSFRLLLDPRGTNTLEVTCAGYDVVTVPLGHGPTITIKLVAAVAPGRESPVSPATLEAIAAPEGPTQTGFLNSEAIFSYRVRGESNLAGGAAVNGFANNDYSVAARVRWTDWLFEGEGTHDQFPVNVNGLPLEENPAYTPSTWTISARASRVWRVQPTLEAAAGLGYRWMDTTPNNKGIPYTSSPLDFEQSHHALGVVGQLAWRSPLPGVTVEGLLGAYPVIDSWVQNPGTSFGNVIDLDGRVEGLYDVIPGIRVGVSYEADSWIGSGADTSQLVGVRLHYVPPGFY